MRRVLLIGLLLLATACSASTGADTAATAGPTGAPTVASDAADGTSDALAFTATTVTGAAFDGGEYAGKDLMLWFWAPW